MRDELPQEIAKAIDKMCERHEDLIDSLKDKSNVYFLSDRERYKDSIKAFAQSITDHVVREIAKKAVSEILPPPEPQLLTWQIWSEGFSMTGDRGTATHHGTLRAKTFKEACQLLARQKLSFNQNYRDSDMTFWGCKLYDNEADARKTFG